MSNAPTFEVYYETPDRVSISSVLPSISSRNPEIIKILRGALLGISLFLLVFLDFSLAQIKPTQFQQAYSAQGDAVKPSWYGKKVRNIKVVIRDVFKDANSFVYHAANNLKNKTKEHIIRQELLIKTGEPITPFLVAESNRNLRTLRYLRDVGIEIHELGDEVDVIVDVRDTWTLIPQAGYSSGDGRSKYAFGIGDSDFLGRGKRVELLQRNEDNNTSIEAVYDDRRVWGTPYQFLAGYFDRDDGSRYVSSLARPFRTLVDRDAWEVTADTQDGIGRLYENNNERYIYRRDRLDLASFYAVTKGDPTKELRRYSYGFGYSESRFHRASRSDFDIINVDPTTIDNDPSRLPDSRRYIGPLFSYTDIEPDYISLTYIDRFDLIEDFNLGKQIVAGVQLAPEAIGSYEDTMLFKASRSQGIRMSDTSFYRAEISTIGRLSSSVENTIMRLENKYYNVMGRTKFLGMEFTKNTVAANMLLEYGYNFDKDNELLVGGDNAVRGYQARSFTGDKRFVVNLEDRIHLVDDIAQLISLGGTVFAEAGGSTFDNYGSLFTKHMYSDVGFGLRIGFPRSGGSRFVRLDVAFPLRDADDGSKQFEPRILLSAGPLFEALFARERNNIQRATVDVGF